MKTRSAVVASALGEPRRAEKYSLCRRVVQRAPQVQAPERAVGAPGLGDSFQIRRARKLVEAVLDLCGAADAEIAGGEHVGTAQVEHQEHLGGPGANALDL